MVKQVYHLKDLIPRIGWSHIKTPKVRRFDRYELKKGDFHYRAMCMPKVDNFVMHIYDVINEEFVFSYINNIDRLAELGLIDNGNSGEEETRISI